MATEKPRISLAEIKRLSSEEGWDDKAIADHFGIKEIDISRVRTQHGIQKKRIYKPRFELIMDMEPEEAVEVSGEAVEERIYTEDGIDVTPQEEETTATVAEEVEQPIEEDNSAAPKGW